MKLGIVVNVMNSDEAGATTYRLGADAINMGHDVWFMSTGNLAYNPNDTVGAFARTVPPGRYTSARFLDLLKSKKAINKWITLDDLDVLLLRNNPSVQQAWSQSAGIHFGRLAMRHGVIVLNDPNGSGQGDEQALFADISRDGCARGRLVTRDLGTGRCDFLDQQGTIILKPLQGSGGTGVCSSSTTTRSTIWRKSSNRSAATAT